MGSVLSGFLRIRAEKERGQVVSGEVSEHRERRKVTACLGIEEAAMGNRAQSLAAIAF